MNTLAKTILSIAALPLTIAQISITEAHASNSIQEGAYDLECTEKVVGALRKHSKCVWAQVADALDEEGLLSFVETFPEGSGSCFKRLARRLDRIDSRFSEARCPDLDPQTLHDRIWDFVIGETGSAFDPEYTILTSRKIRYYASVRIENNASSTTVVKVPIQSVGLHSWEWQDPRCGDEVELAPGESLTCTSPVKDYAGSGRVDLRVGPRSTTDGITFSMSFGTNHCGSATRIYDDKCSLGRWACVGTGSNRGDGDLEITVSLNDAAVAQQCETFYPDDDLF
ncbi:MAG: hypothetical protein HRU01_25985 [Myxococcales bacterium]|nr:hypothetical protein [Myxococcales bacterium]